MINDFNQSYNSNLLLIRQPTYSDQRRQSLVISLESKQPNPDLFLMDVIWIKQFVESGWLEPLTEYTAKDTFDTQIFFKKILNLVDTYYGTLFALPVFMDAGLLYYRTDLLSEYNYSPPETWEELLEQSELIMGKSDKNISGFVWQGAQYEGLVCTFLEFLSSNGGKILDENNFIINSEQNIEALEFMQNLIQKYNISPQNTYTEMKEEEVRRAFQRGNAVFERNWSYAANLHSREGSAVKDKYAVKSLPHFNGNESAAALGGWHIGISSYSDMKEKAWEFVKFITSYNAQKKMVMNIGWNPAREDIYDDKELLQKVPYLNILEEVFRLSVARPNLSYYPQVSDVIQRYVNNCLAGKMTAKEALDEIQNEIEELKNLYEE